MNLWRDSSGKLPTYTSLGGYPMIYLTRKGAAICPDCANGDAGDPPVTGDVFWEGEPLECDECDKPIESAYGPVPSNI